MKRFKKILFKTHRISGSLMSLIFFIWFLSGIVLIFQGFPHASRKDRFLNLSTLTKNSYQHILPPSSNFKGDLELELYNSIPVYRVYRGRKKQEVYDARTLKKIAFFSEEDAKQLCYSFKKRDVKNIILKDELDQWIPWSYYKPLLPFYKCYLDDEKHTVLYISQKTGTIIQETNRKTRWLARIGAIPHWVYFSRLRQNIHAWKNVVIILSSLGLLVCLSGLIMGFIMMVRKKWLTPYKKKWYKWHHVMGYIFGIFTFTFLLSGLLSVTDIPNWMTFTSHKEKITWKHKLNINSHDNYSPQAIYNNLVQKDGVRRIVWKTIFDIPHYFVYYHDYQNPVVYRKEGDNIVLHQKYSSQNIAKEANKKLAGKSYNLSVQREYDNYYKPSGMFYRPMPVYRIDFNDDAESSLYINPKTAERVTVINRNVRMRRWLYRALHTLNFKVFDNAEWLRRLILILISIGGLTLSYTSIVLSLKWVHRKKGRYINKRLKK